MIRFEHILVEGWEPAFRGMRNAFESWDKADSGYEGKLDEEHYYIGPKDMELAQKLVRAGADSHSKFLRMITVSMDITAPLYWWKEYDTYKVGTVANSCSTMHKIHAKEFTMEDFSCEHLMSFDNSVYWEEDDDNACMIENSVHSEVVVPYSLLEKYVIPMLNTAREKYLETKNKKWTESTIILTRKLWWQMIQLLPSSYNQKRTVMLNYQVLRHMYFDRKGHKLDEWLKFREMIETLPYAKELICLEK